MYVPAEHTTSTIAIGPIGIGVVPRHEVERVDGDLTLGELDRLPRPRDRIGPSPVDLDRAVCGRPLRIVPVIAGSAASTASRVGAGPIGRCQLAFEIVGGRRCAEADRGPVRLAVAQVELDDARRPAEEDREDPRSERIERAAVPDAFRCRQPPDQGDDVMRGRPGRFGDDEDAVEPGAERLVGHGVSG